VTRATRVVERGARGGCRDRRPSEISGGVDTEFLAACTVPFEAEGGEADESGVLAGGSRDEDVIVGLTPLQWRSRRGGGDGNEGQNSFQGRYAAIQTLVRGSRWADVGATIRASDCLLLHVFPAASHETVDDDAGPDWVCPNSITA